MVYDAGWSVYPTPHKPTGGAASWPHSVVSSLARRHALMSCILHDCAACARLSWQGRARRWSPWRARPLTSSGPPPSNIPAHPPRTRSALILSVVRLAPQGQAARRILAVLAPQEAARMRRIAPAARERLDVARALAVALGVQPRVGPCLGSRAWRHVAWSVAPLDRTFRRDLREVFCRTHHERQNISHKSGVGTRSGRTRRVCVCARVIL